MIKEFGISCNKTSCVHVGTSLFLNTEVWCSGRLNRDEDAVKMNQTHTKKSVYQVSKAASCLPNLDIIYLKFPLMFGDANKTFFDIFYDFFTPSNTFNWTVPPT